MNSRNKTKHKKIVRLVLLLSFQFICIAAFSQVHISGKVAGADGKGLAGISVVIKNSTYGTATDASGNYTLNADLKPGMYTVEFSGIGYKKREESVNITGAGTYNVNPSLAEDPLGLDEVVVTGTSQGTTRRQLGSYISSVKGDAVNRANPSNVLQGLQGKTRGEGQWLRV